MLQRRRSYTYRGVRRPSYGKRAALGFVLLGVAAILYLTSPSSGDSEYKSMKNENAVKFQDEAVEEEPFNVVREEEFQPEAKEEEKAVVEDTVADAEINSETKIEDTEVDDSIVEETTEPESTEAPTK